MYKVDTFYSLLLIFTVIAVSAPLPKGTRMLPYFNNNMFLKQPALYSTDLNISNLEIKNVKFCTKTILMAMVTINAD